MLMMMLMNDARDDADDAADDGDAKLCRTVHSDRPLRNQTSVMKLHMLYRLDKGCLVYL